ncbi:hypothetical protein [Rhizobium sp. BK376]|uniref:hypothetical protein n=1 Tax=Rhizobium sp. BK376 TaxID=2512149 RepID=UPI0010464824|nr:hypothetical protein [Rhizobium sp. BK376]TCR61899.1 hypothetical protein EV561_1832 [Rhizobium sp. BK376]
MRTNWTVTISNGDRTFDSARDAAAFIKANMGEGELFGLHSPTELSAEDWEYFEGLQIAQIFDKALGLRAKR